MAKNRRQVLKSVAGGLMTAGVAPYGFAKTRRKLRVLGTHVTLQEQLRVRAQNDLGIEIEFSPGGSAEVLHQASTRPESFDLYEQWSNSIKVLWQAGAIQSVETGRLRHWAQINDLTKTGKLTADARVGAGDAPNKLLFVQPDRSLGGSESGHLSFMPYVHNVDSFGYNAAVVPRGTPYESESWTWLLDKRWAGRVALVNEPTIGLFDVALAAQSAGLVSFADIGNLRRDEIDALFKVLVELRQDGHFRGVWNSVPRSVELMSSGEAVIESMFSPGAFALKGQGIDCVYASPREGYRAWHGVMCLSSQTHGSEKDMAYDYMNWWLSGWPGAFIAKQGYYISNPHKSQPHLSTPEWDYWYKGLPAREEILGTDGRVVAGIGDLRDGGSYAKRFANIAVWNTVMDNYEYTLPAWRHFLSAA